VNYQYRTGTTFPVAMRTLYADGGLPRFYRGVVPALIQGPLSRFGDTAANTGMLTLLDSMESTQNLNIGIKTVSASAAAALFRIVLMPIDTVKTTMRTYKATNESSRTNSKTCERYPCSGALRTNSPTRSVVRRLPHDDTEVTGKFSSVIEKVKLGGVLTLYNGSYAAFGATFVGHYPYVECTFCRFEMWTVWT
jgi:Mitochondrial carrier protein